MIEIKQDFHSEEVPYDLKLSFIHPQNLKKSDIAPWFGCYKAWGLYKHQTQKKLEERQDILIQPVPGREIQALKPILTIATHPIQWFNAFTPHYLMIQACAQQSQLLVQAYYLHQHSSELLYNQPEQVEKAYDALIARATEFHVLKEFAKDPDNILNKRMLWMAVTTAVLTLLAAWFYATLLLCALIGPTCLGVAVIACSTRPQTQFIQALDDLEQEITIPNEYSSERCIPR
ncbi:MAG: hypothetical protein CK424_02225 [Legionella sp.]|nr:MAG: hypothetical protein CK424_02225 [Legionella sp.]